MPDAAPRVAIVTGSSGDIGSHLLAHLAASGWTAIGIDRQPPRTDAPESASAEVCDLADAGQAAAAVDRVVARAGAPDLLVNCAGLIANAPLVRLGPTGWETHDPALWRDVIDSGLTSAFHATAASVRHMLAARKKGVVVNVSSVCAAGNPGQVAYSAAKAGLNGFTLALAKELGPLGIRVVGLAPGYFDTASTRNNVPEARLAKIAGAVPMKRLGRVEELADAIDYIVASRYLNGTILELDGGLVV